MSQVPRQIVSIKKVPYGEPRDRTTCDDGETKTLLLSQPHHRLKGGGWSGGGSFFQVDESLHHSGNRHFPGYTRGIYYGPRDAVSVTGVTSTLPVTKPSQYKGDWNGLNAAAFSFGAKFYHMTRPGNPVASLGQFLMELRDLPKIPFVQGRAGYVSLFKQGLSLSGIMRQAREIARNALHWRRLYPDVGGEYLNFLFGWKPFISDLRSIYNLWSSIDRQMAQIIRDNGKSVRRKAHLEKQTEILSNSNNSYSFPGANIRGFPGDYASAGGKSSVTVWSWRVTEVWYSAAYRYYIPDVSSSEWTRRAKLALFGALPTPELIWAVTPFSWLVNWAINVEDVVSNLSVNAVDNLVQLYSFIMRKITTEYISWSQTEWNGRPGCYPAGSGTWISTRKQVIKTRTGGGSPYALSAQSGTPLSSYQLGVLAALGLNLAK